MVWFGSWSCSFAFWFWEWLWCHSVFCMISCEWVARSLIVCHIIIASSREELYTGLGCWSFCLRAGHLCVVMWLKCVCHVPCNKVWCCVSDKKLPGKSKDEQMAEKKQELEKRLQDVTGQLGSAKKPPKKGKHLKLTRAVYHVLDVMGVYKGWEKISISFFKYCEWNHNKWYFFLVDQ